MILAMTKRFLRGLFFLLLLSHSSVFGQAVGINNATPNASSILDVVSPDKGILIPRMGTGARTGIAGAADGLLVFDTDLDGFYYYDATAGAWRAILASSVATELAGWSTLGNIGTNPATNFLGTKDGVDLAFRANNIERFRMNFDNGLEIAPLSFATSTGLSIGALTGTTNTGISIGTANGTTAIGVTVGAFSATTSTGFQVSAMSGATSTGLSIGAMSGATSNTGISIGAISSGTATGLSVGAISGGGVGNAVSTEAISSTGATAYQLNLGAVSGANGTSHGGLLLGNISGATTNAYGLNLGTITGGTSGNYGLNLGSITTTGASNSYGINLAGFSGSGTNVFGLNMNGMTSTGTINTGINIGAISGAGATNSGLTINTISNGTVNNFGLNITGTAENAALNFAIHSDAGAPSFISGDVIIGVDPLTPTPNSKVPVETNTKLEVRGTITGALPLVAMCHGVDNARNGGDDYLVMMAATVPSTNEIWIRGTNSNTVNDNALDNTGNYSAWVNFGSPTGAAGYPYIISIAISCQPNDNDLLDKNHAFITARMSNGDVYVRTANNTYTVPNLCDPTNYDNWTNFGNPGL